MRGFLSALSFLTICPVPARVHRDRAGLRSAPGWYPVVGLLVGGIAAGVFVLLGAVPPLPRAVLVVAIPVLLTRALHLDGFADVCDGFGVSGPVAKRLEVMRDPRLGTFGVAGVVFNLLLRVAFVAALPGSGWIALVAAPAVGRFAMVIALRLSPYAGAGFGAAAVRPSGPQILGAAIVPVAVAWLGSGLPVAVILAYGLAWGWVRIVRSAFGGLTGDALGALNEMTELLVLGLFLLLSPGS